MTIDSATESLLRDLTPQVLGALVRRYGQFEECEDAVQEAVVAATLAWPTSGTPANPRGWLITVASRRLIDQIRSDHARKAREMTVALEELPSAEGETAAADDTLILLYLCCHPALTPASQTALTLRAVGGLTTAEIAHAFLVPEGTMAARISRAKQSIKAAGSQFRMPAPEELDDRLSAVLHTLYLIFNEGYTASSGENLNRAELTHEAIRLTRVVHRQLPNDGEVAGLLALMLLTDSRRTARTTTSGDLIPLAEQDRTRWDRTLIDEANSLLVGTMARSPLGPYQLQAAIAATHADAQRAEETNWQQVHVLYKLLERIAPNPMVTLNRAVALAQTSGPEAALEVLTDLDADPRMKNHHRLHAVRAYLLEMSGDMPAAREQYMLAARGTASMTERRYLESRASQLAGGGAR
ncbi:MAG TPA: sigma-70 family RNA polymerase sigma factor [Acidothermaceae bacterium]